MALRVLFLSTYFPRPLNPLMGTWALQQAQALARNGVAIKVVSLNPWVPKMLARSAGAKAYALAPARYSWDGLEIEYPSALYFPFNPIKKWAYPRPQLALRLAWASAGAAILRAVREHKPDVIYAHHTATNGYFSLRLNQKLALPYVVTDHDFGEVEDCGRFARRRELFQRVHDRASRSIGVSDRMTASLKSLFGTAAVTVHNGTDPVPPALQNNPRPAELADKLVIFSAAMFYGRKGIPLLIEAFAAVAGSHPQAVLRIAGDGPDRNLVEAAAARAHLGHQLVLLGKQPHETIMQEMVWSDFFALIGWDEPFGVVFSEALSAGKPVVCANDGGINDRVRDGVHGYMIRPRDLNAAAEALDKMLTDRAARLRMGAAARELYETHFTWDCNARKMIGIFEEARRSKPAVQT